LRSGLWFSILRIGSRDRYVQQIEELGQISCFYVSEAMSVGQLLRYQIGTTNEKFTIGVPEKRENV
jgi:hypothetical protein